MGEPFYLLSGLDVEHLLPPPPEGPKVLGPSPFGPGGPPTMASCPTTS